jgi:hypothetical protein
MIVWDMSQSEHSMNVLNCLLFDYCLSRSLYLLFQQKIEIDCWMNAEYADISCETSLSLEIIVFSTQLIHSFCLNRRLWSDEYSLIRTSLHATSYELFLEYSPWWAVFVSVNWCIQALDDSHLHRFASSYCFVTMMMKKSMKTSIKRSMKRSMMKKSIDKTKIKNWENSKTKLNMLNELNSRTKKTKSTAHAKKLALTAKIAAHTNETTHDWIDTSAKYAV